MAESLPSPLRVNPPPTSRALSPSRFASPTAKDSSRYDASVVVDEQMAYEPDAVIGRVVVPEPTLVGSLSLTGDEKGREGTPMDEFRARKGTGQFDMSSVPYDRVRVVSDNDTHVRILCLFRIWRCGDSGRGGVRSFIGGV